MEYTDFIQTKLRGFQACGFEPTPHIVPMFDWQRELTNWAIRKGRAALYEECGLGKTRQQLEWARQVVDHTGKPVLILCPLAVANQTVREATACGLLATRVKDGSEIVEPGIYVTNYHRLDKFDDVIDRALLLWSNPGDVVLSPFAGIGSEGYESLLKGRKFIGFELKESYYKHACEFLQAAEREGGDLFQAQSDGETDEDEQNELCAS